MAQILDLSTIYTQEQIETAKQGSDTLDELPAGGYICKVINAILNNDPEKGRQNIELQVDIAEGDYAGYFQKLSDRWGFWGLRGWMSFKESELGRFEKTCMAFMNSNPGLVFNPFVKGGVDVDKLIGKKIGVVTGKEQYKSNSGDTRDKNVVSYFTEISKIKEGKFRIPKPKLLPETPEGGFMAVTDGAEAIPFS